MSRDFMNFNFLVLCQYTKLKPCPLIPSKASHFAVRSWSKLSPGLSMDRIPGMLLLRIEPRFISLCFFSGILLTMPVCEVEIKFQEQSSTKITNTGLILTNDPSLIIVASHRVVVWWSVMGSMIMVLRVIGVLWLSHSEDL